MWPNRLNLKLSIRGADGDEKVEVWSEWGDYLSIRGSGFRR